MKRPKISRRAETRPYGRVSAPTRNCRRFLTQLNPNAIGMGGGGLIYTQVTIATHFVAPPCRILLNMSVLISHHTFDCWKRRINMWGAAAT